MAANMNDVIKRLAVSLSLETAAFEKGATLAEKRAAKMGSEMSKLGATFSKLGAALGASVAGAAGGMAVLVRESINVADELSKAASSTGIAVEELSRLRYAADLSGVTFEQLQTAVGRLSRNMFDASQGTGQAREAFAQLGVQVTNADGTLRSATEVMGDLADRFAAMDDGAAKTALSMEIFGRAGASLIPMLNGGRDGLRELTAEADRFGVVIDAETGRRAEQFNDNLSRLQGVFSSLATQIAADTLPALVAITDTLVANAGAIRDATKGAVEFGRGVAYLSDQVSAATGGMIGKFFRVADSVRSMVEPLQVVIRLVRYFGQRGDGGTFGSMGSTMMDMGRQAIESAKALKALEPVASSSGAAIARGVGGGAQQASAGLSQVAKDADDMGRRVQAVLDRIFPELARARRLSEDLALIDGAGLSDDLRGRARLRLLGEGQAPPPVSEGLLNTGPLVDFQAQAKELQESLGGLASETATQTVRIAESFRDMAQNSVRALDDMVNAIKGGGFLDILGSALNLFLQLGSSGLFGKGFAATVNAPPRIPGFANGTSFAPGGLAMVGERGPELVNLPRGSQVISNQELRAASSSGLKIEVVANNNGFGAIVRNHAGMVVAEASPAIMQGSAQVAASRFAQRQTRRIG